MAAADPAQLFLGELTCSVCLDYFQDPVALDCGHNFCQACINVWWEGLKTDFRCPECRDTFSHRNFKRNRQLRNVVEASRTLRLESTNEPEVSGVCKKHGEVLKVFCQEDQSPICMICHLSRDHKDHTVVPIDEAAQGYKDQILSHLKTLKKNRKEVLTFRSNEEKKSQELLKKTETERQKIVSEFQQLRQFLETQERFQLAQLDETEQDIIKKRDGYIDRLNEEISLLNKLICEVYKKCRQSGSEFLQDIRSTLRRCERKTFQNPLSLSPELKWGSWNFSEKSTILQNIQKKCRESFSSEWKLHKVNVTLDPDTAHPELIVSEDRKSVRRRDTEQALPNNPGRFDTKLCVLGCEGFTAGRHCWEVEAMGLCAVGVARESVSRNGKINFSPKDGVWAVEWSGEQWCRAPTSPVTSLFLIKAPSRIRVYLDYERGKVAFIDAGKGDPIFTFPTTFFTGETICPFFRVGFRSLSGPFHPSSQLTLCP
ncbi:E3 ubiquitin-protein ligase TRIM39-like [Chelonoidis abingdonii]|uniref:E3 ubiquitin-protein ligase TRIM39-like n=1 Tax=Chelonoidis abingdonii TaxID=106734 RepID=UPI0013F25458|nr:E3 ubiquitin-protein ligase TRIM39-like [Chelonoidis abingdonii]